MYKFLLLLFSFALIGIGCRKDSIDVKEEPIDPIVETNYVKNVVGVVETELGEPIEGVTISVGSEQYSTDENGLFSIEGLKVGDLNGAFINVDHRDYFESGARIYATTLDEDFVKIVLVEKEISGSFSADEEGEISLDDGTIISFPADAIKSENGPYTGPVYVSAYHLDPADDDFLLRSPGDLSAVNAEGERGTLKSFGMLAVELEGSSGEKLNIADGKMATIKIPVDDALLSEANETIPLWHFDTDLHKWVEEGTATLQNGVYVGQVSHFSWWNCDDFFNGVTLCVQLLQPARNSYFTQVKIQLSSGNYGITCGWTDEDGRVCGLIPRNEELTMTVYDNCGGILYQDVIGPFLDDPSEILIDVNIPSPLVYTFTGSITECGSANGIDGAVVKFSADNAIVYSNTNANGDYEFTQILCEEMVDYSILAIDPINAKSGFGTSTATYGAPADLDLDLCDEAAFLVMNDELGNPIFQSNDLIALVKPNETLIKIDGQSGNLSGYIGISGSGSGEHPMNLYITQYAFSEAYATAAITQWGDVGDVIKGTFEVMDPSGSQVQLSGSFAATRTE